MDFSDSEPERDSANFISDFSYHTANSVVTVTAND